MLLFQREDSQMTLRKHPKNLNKPTPHQIICRVILTLFGEGIVLKRLFVIIVKETHTSSAENEF